PSLEALLIAPELSEARFNVDLKVDRPGIEDTLAGVLSAHGAGERACLGAEDDGLADRLRTALPDACFFHPAGERRRCVRAVGAARRPADEGWQVLATPLFHQARRLVTPALLERVAEMGKWLYVWTVDDPAQLRRVVQEGVGGIITDRPDLLAEILA